MSIENGSKKFTSLGRAISFVKRGHAEWIEPNKKIRFLEIAHLMRIAHEQAEQHLLDDRGGKVFWNGRKAQDPVAMCKPGEVRS